MKKMRLIALSFGILCSVMTVSAFADRVIQYVNNTDYNMKLWFQECWIEQAGAVPKCTKEYYLGVIGAHQLMNTPKMTKKPNGEVTSWVEIGDHITAAIISSPLPDTDPKTDITRFPICNGIHEDGVNDKLIFDIDSVSNKITCRDEIIPN